MTVVHNILNGTNWDSSKKEDELSWTSAKKVTEEEGKLAMVA